MHEGENLKRLVAVRAAQLMSIQSQKVCASSDSCPFLAEIATHILDGSFLDKLKEAGEWATEMCQMVVDAPDTSWHDHEAAAGELLRRLIIKEQEQRARRLSIIKDV